MFYSRQLLIRSLNFDELNHALGKQNKKLSLNQQIIGTMVHTEENQHKFLIFQIMSPYSTHTMIQEFPTYSLVY